MIKKEEIYDELDFLKFGEMLLLNPNDKLEQPCFFIKERDAKIEELINRKYISYEVRFFTVGRVIANIILFIFDEDNENIYGQWINIYNKTDKKNFIELNFKENIYIVLIDKNNIVKHIDIYENPFRNNVRKIFKKDNKKVVWSQKEFEEAISIFNEFESKKSFYEAALEHCQR